MGAAAGQKCCGPQFGQIPGRCLTLLIPVFNEEECLPELFNRVNALCERLGEKCVGTHFLFLDNGSSDSSWDLILSFVAKSHRSRAVRFARNYGFQSSLTYGIGLVGTDSAVVLQSDLQDPPELIDAMVDAWLAGARVVGASPISRSEGRVIRSLRRIFYGLLALTSDRHTQVGIQDFYLLDLGVCREIALMKPQHQILRSYIGEFFGFDAVVKYRRNARFAGSPSLSLSDYYEIAMDGFLLNGKRGIRSATLAAFGFAVVGFATALTVLSAYVLGWQPALVGWLSLVLVIGAGGALILSFIGVVLEFLQRIVKSPRGAPDLLVRSEASQL